MHFTNFVLASAFVLTAAANVCGSGLYKALAPLSSYAPAQSLCAQRFPRSTVTVTMTRAGLRRRVEAPRATTSASQAATTTVSERSVAAAGRRTTTTTARTTSAQASPSSNARNQNPTTTTTSRATTLSTSSRTTSRDSREAVWSSISAQAGAILSTFCSCANPPATVTSFANPPTTATSSSSTSSTTTSSTTTSSAPPAPTCGIACELDVITDVRSAPQCKTPGTTCGFCVVPGGSGYRGTCGKCAGDIQLCNVDSDCCNAGPKVGDFYCPQFGNGWGTCNPRPQVGSRDVEIEGLWLNNTLTVE